MNDDLDELMEKILGKMKEYIDLSIGLVEKRLKDLEKDFTFHKHN